jgi:small redox-active disulfide protein 2
MKIEILGMGCAKCKQLMANAEKAVKEAGVQAEVVKVEDMNQIVGYGYNAPTCLDQS